MYRYLPQVRFCVTFEDETRSRTGQSLSKDPFYWSKTYQTADQGPEFLNQKFLRDNNIDFFTVNSGLKASVVQRFNGTFKYKMFKYFTAKNTLTYIDVLPQLVSSYNNTFHRSIKMKPSQVTKANEARVWDTLYGDDVQMGDRIRISKVKRMFEKSYLVLGKKFLLLTSEWPVKYPFIN